MPDFPGPPLAITRPRSNAVTSRPGLVTPAEHMALRAIDEQRRQNLRQLFGGTHFEPKLSARAKRAKELAQSAKQAAAEARNALQQVDLPVVDLRLPDISLPNFTLPSIALPDLDLPGLPGINLPGLPNLELPDFDLPRIALPDFPDLPSIDLNLPDLDFPQLQLPSIDIPGLGSLDLRIPGIRSVLHLLMELFDGLDLPDIAMEIGAEFILDFVATALPVLGQIKSGAQAAAEWGRAARRGYQVYRVTGQKAYMLPGDPVAAADGVKRLLQREAALHSGKASIRTAQFASSTVALALDAGAISGPLISAGSALAKLSMQVYTIGIQHKEKQAGNELLRNPGALDASVFGPSPILGAYLLTCSNTSDIVNLLTSDIGTPGWMDRTEVMKRKIDPLLLEATKLIRASPYELLGLPANKGIYVKKKKNLFGF